MLKLHTYRTATGYVAALRTQDGREVGRGACSIDEAKGYVMERHGAGPHEVGAFSFGKLAKSIGRFASKVAKMKAIKSFLGAASMLPPPIGTVAGAVGTALKVIAAIKKGNPAAVLAWQTAAAKATAAPNSPTAVAMRLAMKAAGRPELPAGAAVDVLDMLKAQQPAQDAQPAAEPPDEKHAAEAAPA